LSRSTRITLVQVLRKVPSMPDTSIAFTSIRVKRNGTFSGNLRVSETRTCRKCPLPSAVHHKMIG
jgi:hypothetical protein